MTCEVTLCEALANNWQLLAKASLNTYYQIPDDYVDFFEKGGFLSVPIFEYLEGRFVV